LKKTTTFYLAAQPLLIDARRYFDECGRNATERHAKGGLSAL
jgi:hypothetical protein